MKVCTKAIEEAIASETTSKINAAKMLIRQHNKAYKDPLGDGSTNPHWDENAIAALEQKADAKLQEIAQKNM